MIFAFIRLFFADQASFRRLLWQQLVTMLMAVMMASCISSPEYIGTRGCDSENNQPGYPTCLPQSSDFFCPKAKKKTADAQAGEGNKLYVGQFAPSKEALGSAGQPRCPQRPEAFITEMDKKFVKDGAQDVGKTLAKAVVSCDAAMQSLTEKTDPHLAAIQNAHPRAIETVLENCQNDLAAVPMIPAYESPELVGIAKAAFEEGFQAGVDEAFRRILLIEVGLSVLEVVFFETIPIIEVAMVRSIRRSVDAVREMPLFLPVALNGMGVSVKVGRIIKGSSRALGRNLRDVGTFKRAAGEFAHHIVAHGDNRAKKALAILDKYGIDVNDWVNGVFLPGYKSSPNPDGKIVHSVLHTDAYYKAVDKALESATSRDDVVKQLRLIAFKLQHGIMP